MSIFYPMQDEHIGSFLFRKHMFSGKVMDLEFTNDIVVQCSNSWRLFPYANEEEVTAESYNKHTLGDLFRPTSAPSFTDAKNNIQHRADYNSIGARYCPACFRDQISQNGFFWFRREWLIYGNDCCIKHRCQLINFNCDKCCVNFRISVGVQSYLRGRCLKCGAPIKLIEPSYVTRIPPMIDWASQLLRNPLPYLSQRLIAKLLHQTYDNESQSISNTELAKHIYNMCNISERYGMRKKHIHSSALIDRGHKMEDVARFLASSEQFAPIPYLVFWSAMISTFRTFPRFIENLSTISVARIDTSREFLFEYLDLL